MKLKHITQSSNSRTVFVKSQCAGIDYELKVELPIVHITKPKNISKNQFDSIATDFKKLIQELSNKNVEVLENDKN